MVPVIIAGLVSAMITGVSIGYFNNMIGKAKDGV
jgi:hypothetical protein